jgi:hypothetical protein
MRETWCRNPFFPTISLEPTDHSQPFLKPSSGSKRFSFNRGQRRLKNLNYCDIMMSRLTALLLFTSCMCGCSPTSSAPLTPQNVVGSYKGSYGGATETFVFRADGTFTQVLVFANKPQYTNDGQWQIKGNQTQVELRNVYVALDLKGKLRQSPEKMYNMDGLWVSLGQRQRIVFNIGHGYAIDKVPPFGPPETK